MKLPFGPHPVQRALQRQAARGGGGQGAWDHALTVLLPGHGTGDKCLHFGSGIWEQP